MKKPKPSVRQLVADAKAAGLSVTSRGVNTAALSGTTATPVRLDDARVADVDWHGLPQEIWTDMPEDEWQAMVVAKARAFGWEVYHTLDSRGSESGFPDLVLARPPLVEHVFAGRVMYAELKAEGGVQSDAQKKWEKLLRDGGHAVFLWRPSDWRAVTMILQGTLTA